jgi:hypothetical protein
MVSQTDLALLAADPAAAAAFASAPKRFFDYLAWDILDPIGASDMLSDASQWLSTQPLEVLIKDTPEQWWVAFQASPVWKLYYPE